MTTQDGKVVIEIDSNAEKVNRQFIDLNATTDKYERILERVKGTANANLPVYQKMASQLETQKGKISQLTTQYMRMSNVKFDVLSNSLNQLNSRMRDLAVRGQAGSTEFNQLASSARTLQRNINEADSAVNKATGNVGLLSNSMTFLKGAVAATAITLATVKLKEFAQDASETSMQMDALTNKMNAAAGGSQLGAESMKFVREESERLGLVFLDTAKGFAGFEASALRAGLTFNQTKEIFTNVATAAASMQLPAEQVQLIFKGLEQMAGKSYIQMEELKGQLGDSLPGAFEIAAQSMGVTTAEFNKMIANGEILATDFLPKFARAIKEQLGASATEAATQARAEFNRTQTTILDLKDSVGDQLNPQLMKLNSTLRNDIKAATDDVGDSFGRASVLAEGLAEDLYSIGVSGVRGIKPLIPVVYALGVVLDGALSIASDFIKILAFLPKNLQPINVKRSDFAKGEEGAKQYKEAVLKAVKAQQDFGKSNTLSYIDRVKTGYAGVGKEVEKLDKKQQDFSKNAQSQNKAGVVSTYDALDKKVKGLKTSLEDLEVQGKRGSAEYNKLMGEYKKYSTQLNTISDRFKKHSDATKNQTTEYDKFGQSVNKLQDRLRILAMNGQTNTQEFKNSKLALAGYTKQIEDAQRAIVVYTNSYDALNGNLQNTQRQMNILAADGKANTLEFKNLQKEATSLSIRLNDIKNATQINLTPYDALENKLKQAQEEMKLLASQDVVDVNKFNQAKQQATELATKLKDVNLALQVDTSPYDALNNKISQLKSNLEDLAVSGQAGTPAFESMKNQYVEASNKMEDANRQVANAAGLDWSKVAGSIRTDLASALTTPLSEGETAFERFGNFAINTISMIGQAAISQLLEEISLTQVLNAVKAVGKVLSFGLFADGGAFQGGSQLTAYAKGGVVSRPTIFPMANGGTGLMGEAGAEAVMPLRRTSNGKLGVEATGQTGSNVNIYNQSQSNIEKVKRPNGDTDLFIRKVNNALASERTQNGFSKAAQRQQSRGVTAA